MSKIRLYNRLVRIIWRIMEWLRLILGQWFWWLGTSRVLNLIAPFFGWDVEELGYLGAGEWVCEALFVNFILLSHMLLCMQVLIAWWHHFVCSVADSFFETEFMLRFEHQWSFFWFAETISAGAGLLGEGRRRQDPQIHQQIRRTTIQRPVRLHHRRFLSSCNLKFWIVAAAVAT